MAQSLNRVIKYEKGRDSLHRTLVDAVYERKKFSLNKLEDRRAVWDKIDERVQAYIPETDKDAYLKRLRTEGKPQYTTIHIPWSYAVLLSAHTYMTTTFLSRNPVHQVMGRHGESVDQVLGVEAVLDYHTNVGGLLNAYYYWFYDSYKYGIGILGTHWDTCYETVSNIELRRDVLFGEEVGPGRKVQMTERVLGYEGNRGFNVRPHDWLPDPRVPLNHFQKGEFCGRIVTISVNDLRKGKAEGRYFNVEAAIEAGKSHSRTQDRPEGAQLAELPDEEDLPWDRGSLKDVAFVEAVEMVIELVPEQWGLGRGEVPEKWVFTVVLDEVLVGARPLGEYHNKFPYQAMESDFNAHSFVNMSPLEQVAPMEDVLTWLINSHFYNVRKTLNNELVVDPSRVEMQDLLNPRAGGLIRLKPSAYGTNAKDAVFQLATVDVTRGHLADSAVMVEMLNRLTGINEAMMGNMHQGGRKTATEVRSATGFGISRMRTLAEFYSASAFAPLAQMLIQSTQQHLSTERMYRIAGSMAGKEPFVRVSPETIAGFYDFVPVDGTMPIDRYAQVALWKDLLASMATIPAVVRRYDLGRMFGWMAKLAGLKNLDNFQVQVSPDQALAEASAAGNVVPLGGAGGGGEANRPELGAGGEGGQEVSARVSRPRQVPGVGPTL